MRFTKGNLRDGFHRILEAYGLPTAVAKVLADRLTEVTLASDDVSAIGLLSAISHSYPSAGTLTDVVRNLVRDAKHANQSSQFSS